MWHNNNINVNASKLVYEQNSLSWNQIYYLLQDDFDKTLTSFYSEYAFTKSNYDKMWLQGLKKNNANNYYHYKKFTKQLDNLKNV